MFVYPKMIVVRLCRVRKCLLIRNVLFLNLQRSMSDKVLCDDNIDTKPKLVDKNNSSNSNNMLSSLIVSETTNLTPDAFQKRIELLEKLSISKRFLHQYPQLFSMRSNDLIKHLSLLRHIKLEDDAVMEILVKDPALILKCYKTCKNDLRKFSEHRLHYLSKELKISQKELCLTLEKYRFLLSLSFSKIKEVLCVLFEHKVDPGDIFSDLWILRCRTDTVAYRLSNVRDADVENIRPWMARCKREIFESFMNRVSTKQKLLGQLSLEEYISQRLGCSPSEIKDIIDREPQLQRTSVLKIKKILDFLFTSGFSADHILLGLPRVANRRIETINARLQEMNQVGISPSLYVVCKSKREYQYYLNKRKKGDNKR